MTTRGEIVNQFIESGISDEYAAYLLHHISVIAAAANFENINDRKGPEIDYSSNQAEEILTQLIQKIGANPRLDHAMRLRGITQNLVFQVIDEINPSL